jgi:phosphoglycerate dehydrogenase-like enzyme
MNNTDLTLLVSTPVVTEAVDAELLKAHGITLLTTPYEIESSERVAREQDPVAARRRGEPAPLNEEQLEAFGRADMMISFDAPLDLPAIAPRLRWIQTIGSGVGQYEASIGGSDIVLTNAAGLAAGSIADWIVGRILEVHNRFIQHRSLQDNRDWQSWLGSDIAGSTVLIVGLGAIGRATAKRLRAFGPRLIGVRRSYTEGMSDPDVDELIGPSQMHDALGRCDTVVVCAAGHGETDDLFDAAAFDAMVDRSIFINVARGHLVVEPALIAALESGKLRAAAIDVARNEPLGPRDPLWDAPNLSISPHSSATAERYGERVFAMFAENLPLFLAGEPLQRVVDEFT